MCKVRIINKGNNYSDINSTSVEMDIPSESVPVIKQVFSELNKTRISAICPLISIVEL